MVISAIMINRITLNLKRESAKRSVITWSTRTFEHLNNGDSDKHSGASESIELKYRGAARAGVQHFGLPAPIGPS